jgi:hypothetical protein
MQHDSCWRLLEAQSILQRLMGNPDMEDPEYRRCWLGTVLGNLETVHATECHMARSARPSEGGTNPSNIHVTPSGEGVVHAG